MGELDWDFSGKKIIQEIHPAFFLFRKRFEFSTESFGFGPMESVIHKRRKFVAVAALLAAADHYEKRMDKQPERTSALDGNAHVAKLLQGSDVRFKRASRMDRGVFDELVHEMRDRGLLHDLRKGITVERYTLYNLKTTP